jgi:small conductance mechanosensitive channel
MHRPFIAYLILPLVLFVLTTSARVAHADDPPIVVEARALLEDIDRLEREFKDLRTESREAQEADATAIAELQARRRLVEWMRVVEDLVANLAEQQEQGLDASKFLQATRKLLWSVDRRLPPFFDRVSSENADLRGQLVDALHESAIGIEQRIRGNEELLDEGVRFYISHIEHMDQLKLGSTRARASAAEVLERRAGNLAAKLELERLKLDEQEGLEGTGVDGESAARSTQEDLDRTAASLWTVCDALDELDLPTAQHRKVLILATGELTTDVLDKEVLAELADTAFETSQIWIEQRGPVLMGRLARFFGVLVIFWILGRITRSVTSRLVESSGEQMSQLAKRIVVATAARVVVGIGFFVALSQIGVNVTALLAGLGIVGFIIGFALQETLGNFAAGAMILFYQPFDVGDVIEAAGVTGKVDRMNLVSTTILTFDNQTLIIPNNRIWGDVIRNSTAMDQRRVDLSFPLALDVDIEEAEALFDSICRAHPAVLEEPEPAIRVQKITGAGVLFVVRPWVRTADYWSTYWDLNREAHVQLARAGIRIAAARYKLEDQDSTDAQRPQNI